MLAQISPGTLINSRYRIDKLLGQGGFGRTYLAFDTQRFSEPCVLKEFVPANTKAEILRKSQELFEREAKVLYKIDHPQIPKFLAWFTEKDRLFIVQEYIDGKNYWQILHDRLSGKRQPFSEAEVRTWLTDMIPILEYIHERNIIHRDISLENIMLPNDQSKPMLIDFGVVKEKFTQILAADPNKQYSSRGSVVGKMGYSPPEQLRLGYCYPSSDIYALGVCVVVLLTGRMPHLLIDDSFKWQWRSYVNITASLAGILDKMLAEVPTERYQSAGLIFKDLNSSQKTLQVQVSPLQNQAAITRQNSEENQPTTFPGQAPVSLNAEFLQYCQKELTSFVGPFASYLMKHTLEKSPGIAVEEFLEKVTAAIPNKKLAQEFREHIKLPDEINRENIQQSYNNSHANIGNYPAISNPEFLERCRRELTSFVGPFASVIIKDALDQQPNLTPTQLIETLVAEIPNQKRAEEFKERIQKQQL